MTSRAGYVIGGVRNKSMQYRRAIIDVNIGVTVFLLQDLVIKYVSHDYPLWQLLLLRSALAVPLVLIMLRWLPLSPNMAGERKTFLPVYSALPQRALHFFGWKKKRVLGLSSLLSTNWKFMTLRSFGFVTAFSCYYMAFPIMPIGNAVALFLTAPLFLTLFGFFLNREPIYPYQWLAIFLGFVGSMLIIRPFPEFFQALSGGLYYVPEEFDPATLLPLLTAIVYAFVQSGTRRYLKNESPIVMSGYQNIIMLLFAVVAMAVVYMIDFDFTHQSAVFFTRDFEYFQGYDLWVLLATAPIGVVGHIFLSSGYRTAPTTVVAPFEYIGMLIGFLAGFLFWGEIPTFLSIIGALLILLSGIVVVRANRRSGLRTG